jgi:ATP adenylyltransferase
METPLKHIWTPWRIPYVVGQVKREGCVFCEIVAQSEESDAANYLVHRGRRAFAVLNLYPYNNGHLLILPYEHVSSLEALEPDTQADMTYLVSYFIGALRAGMSPGGFNVGMNLGKVAGAGITDHIHIHVVPRWAGDTNFMPVLSNTRVIPEMLDDTYRNLRAFVEQTPPPC